MSNVQQGPHRVDISVSGILTEGKIFQVSSGSVVRTQAPVYIHESIVAIVVQSGFAWPSTDAAGIYKVGLWGLVHQESHGDSPTRNTAGDNRIPAEVEVFAYANNIESALYSLEEKARRIFPGICDFSLSLESDPEGDKFKYIRVTVTLDADERSALSALSAFDDWLLEVLPDEKLLLVSVGVDFAADAAK